MAQFIGIRCRRRLMLVTLLFVDSTCQIGHRSISADVGARLGFAYSIRAIRWPLGWLAALSLCHPPFRVGIIRA